MRWRLGSRAELARRRNDTSAEVMLPDAVNHHARGEGIFGAGDPIGEASATEAVAFRGVIFDTRDLRWIGMVFPLTPALSLGEREPGLACLREAGSLVTSAATNECREGRLHSVAATAVVSASEHE